MRVKDILRQLSNESISSGRIDYPSKPEHNSKLLLILFLFVILFVSISAVKAAETAAELLEKAIYTEETVGDLPTAITIYQKVLVEAKKGEAQAAEAQYRLGKCLLKQKKTDKAVAAFQKVVDSYPDQKDWVAKAKLQIPVLLKYDDNGMESKRSIAGGGHAVLFKAPGEGDWFIDQVQLFGSRYGTDRAPNESFSIYITDKKMENFRKIAKPYSTFVKGDEKWTTIKITPVQVPEEFYVCFVFNPTQTKGIYVGMDENVEESHSKNAVPGEHISDMPKKADWMIRAHLTPIATGKPLQLLGKNEQEKSLETETAYGNEPETAYAVSVEDQDNPVAHQVAYKNIRVRTQPAVTEVWNSTPPSVEPLPNNARELILKYEADKKPIQNEARLKTRKLQLPLIASLKELQDQYTKDAKLDEAIAVRQWVRYLQQLADNILPDPGTLQNFNSHLGEEFYFRVTGRTNGTIWGSDVYTTDSALAVAAVHTGIIKVGESGVVKVTILSGQQTYQGTERNGISSNSWQSFPASYKVESGNDRLNDETSDTSPEYLNPAERTKYLQKYGKGYNKVREGF